MGNTGTAYLGKWGEYIAIAELLRRGFDVYIPLVDNQGIDCVIRHSDNDYVELQIKARSADCERENAGKFTRLKIPKPRENYFFIFYSEQAKTFWILPSTYLVAKARKNKTGDNKGTYNINLTGVKKGEAYALSKYSEYENNFEILRKIDCTP